MAVADPHIGAASTTRIFGFGYAVNPALQFNATITSKAVNWPYFVTACEVVADKLDYSECAKAQANNGLTFTHDENSSRAPLPVLLP